MFIAISYLIDRLFYRFAQFFVHWYGHSFFIIGGWAVKILERLDRFFAVKINARHFLDPLYQDYTFLGRILGLILRSLRIISGTAVYTGIIAIFVLIYLAWAAIPALLFLNSIYS